MKTVFGVALVAILFAVGVTCQWSPVGAKNPRDFTGYERKYLKVHRQPGSKNYDVTTMHEIVEKSLGKKVNGKKRELIEESYTTNDITDLQQPISNTNVEQSAPLDAQPIQDDYEASSVRSLRKKRPVKRWRQQPPQEGRQWGKKRTLRVIPRRLRRPRRVILDPLPYIPQSIPQPRKRRQRKNFGKKMLSSIVGFGVQLLKRAKKQMKRAKSALRPVRRSFLALPETSLVSRRPKRSNSNRWKSAARPMFKNYRETNLDTTEDRDNERQRRDRSERESRDDRDDRNDQDNNDDNQQDDQGQEDDSQEQDDNQQEDNNQNDNSSRNDDEGNDQQDQDNSNQEEQEEENQDNSNQDDNQQKPDKCQRKKARRRSNKKKSSKKSSKKRAPLSELEL